MQCINPDECPAKRNPAEQCWEIASDPGDYRKANNICRDCIVYMLKGDNSILSQQEIETILAQKLPPKMLKKLKEDN
jgi:hypothetical protein